MLIVLLAPLFVLASKAPSIHSSILSLAHSLQFTIIVLELEVDWPPFIADFLASVQGVFSFSLARPECAFSFSIADQLNFVLIAPVAVAGILLLSSLFFQLASSLTSAGTTASASAGFTAFVPNPRKWTFFKVKRKCRRLALLLLTLAASQQTSWGLKAFKCLPTLGGDGLGGGEQQPVNNNLGRRLFSEKEGEELSDDRCGSTKLALEFGFLPSSRPDFAALLENYLYFCADLTDSRWTQILVATMKTSMQRARNY